MSGRFTIRTPNGYVGRWSLDEDLRDDCPKGFCYSWPKDEADKIAAAFAGATVEPAA